MLRELISQLKPSHSLWRALDLCVRMSTGMKAEAKINTHFPLSVIVFAFRFAILGQSFQCADYVVLSVRQYLNWLPVPLHGFSIETAFCSQPTKTQLVRWQII